MSVVKNLVKQYENFSLDIPEWYIEDHGVTMLWGASGSGKTTAIRMLVGLEDCKSLQWWFGEENVASLPPSNRHIGVVFQSLALFPHLSAKENILFPTQARGRLLNENEWKQLVDFFELHDFIERKARHLSGGERQRVALARALSIDPKILILDEPFSALDIHFKKQVRTLLKKIAEEKGIPILLVSHDPIDAEQLARRVVIFEKGKIKASQSPEEFLQQVHN